MINLLYIDLFCGAGDTSTGVNSARLDGEECAKVVACVNHDANAIASHASNHPDALHFTEDIRTLELSPLVAHLDKCRVENPKALTVLWASLECTNFSKAKGGMPRDADSRTLAEHLFRYIEALDPDYIQIENVEEFMSWGDVDKNGKEIYEGDIIRIDSHAWLDWKELDSVNAEVIFEEYMFDARWRNPDAGQPIPFHPDDDPDYESEYICEMLANLPNTIEVIGNIYNNPELIK